MAERVLAHVERIHNIRPIDGADKIEQVNVLGWNLVTLKGEFKDGDLAVYIEVDSRVPSDKECFAFLEKKKYKVKSTRIRGVFSQGLALPLSILPEGNYSEGTDVTEILGITKIQEDYVAPVMSDEDKLRQHYKKIYKNPIIRFFLKHSFTRKIVFKIFLKKKKKKNWPEWVVKTDEVRVQNIPWVLENKSPFIATEKCISGRMLVRTSNGLKRIADIVNQKLPVLVASYNTETKRVEYKRILDYHKIPQDKLDHYKIGVGHRGKGNRLKFIECTENHKLYVNGQWVEAKDVQIGDKLSHYAEKLAPEIYEGACSTQVLSIENMGPKSLGAYMYDITIEDNSNYFAQGVLVHNCDGTSSTYTLKRKGKKFDFYVCSRNVLQDTPERKCFYDDNVYWEMAKKYNIEQALRTLIGNNEWITLQGEIIGPTIQKNKYELKERELRAFNLITSQNGRVPSDKARDILDAFNIPFVPIISNNYILPDTIDELMTYSTGTSALHDTLREGIVFRNYDQNISFKCVSNDFLLKWNI